MAPPSFASAAAANNVSNTPSRAEGAGDWYVRLFTLPLIERLVDLASPLRAHICLYLDCFFLALHLLQVLTSAAGHPVAPTVSHRLSAALLLPPQPPLPTRLEKAATMRQQVYMFRHIATAPTSTHVTPRTSFSTFSRHRRMVR